MILSDDGRMAAWTSAEVAAERRQWRAWIRGLVKRYPRAKPPIAEAYPLELWLQAAVVRAAARALVEELRHRTDRTDQPGATPEPAADSPELPERVACEEDVKPGTIVLERFQVRKELFGQWSIWDCQTRRTALDHDFSALAEAKHVCGEFNRGMKYW